MFNTAITKLNAPPVSVVLNWKASYDQSQGDLIDMSQAVPGYTAHDDMLAALAEAAANPELARYGPVEGDMPLRKSYARHLSDFYQATIAADNIQITSGCNQAFVATALAVAGQDDRVVMMARSYSDTEADSRQPPMQSIVRPPSVPRAPLVTTRPHRVQLIGASRSGAVTSCRTPWE